MHLAEGVLPAEWCVAWAVPAAAVTAVGVKKLADRAKIVPSFKALAGLVGAFVFAVSLLPIPVPVAGSVSHPCGTPLAAIVLGPFVSVVLGAITLLFQALFFAHGGLSTWGANIMSEGVAGSFMGAGVFFLSRRAGLSLFAAGFLAGLLGDLAVYAVTALELSLGLFGVANVGHEWPALFGAFLPVQGPIAVGEALVTGGALAYVAKVRPDILIALRVMKPDASRIVTGAKLSDRPQISNPA